MAEHRQRVDKRVSREVIARVINPLLLDLGARYLVTPYLGRSTTTTRRRSRGGSATSTTATSATGPASGSRESLTATATSDEGRTRSIEVDRRVVWSVKHDNRLVQNDETRASKVMTYDETYNKIRTFSSFDLLNRFSASAQGEIAGIGGSVSNTTETRLHTELETEIFNKQKTERIIDTSARICYPGPLYRDDKDSNGVVIGRTLVEEGPIWLVERPVATIHTITPITQWGIWDSRIVLDVYDWAGNYGILPSGEHKNEITFAGFNELIAFMSGDLVLQYKWSAGIRGRSVCRLQGRSRVAEGRRQPRRRPGRVGAHPRQRQRRGVGADHRHGVGFMAATGG